MSTAEKILVPAFCVLSFVLIVINICDIFNRRKTSCSGKIKCTGDGGLVVDTGSKCSKIGTRTYRKTGTCLTTKSDNLKEVVRLTVSSDVADVWFSLNVRVVAAYNVLDTVQVATWSFRHVGVYNKKRNLVTLSKDPEIFSQHLSQDTCTVHLNCPVVATKNHNQLAVAVSGYSTDPNLDDTVTWGVELETLELYKRN